MQLHSISERSCAPAKQGKAQHALVHANSREAPRVWGVGKELPSLCWEAAHSAVSCPGKRPSQPRFLFAEGLARPFPEHRIQSPATEGSYIPPVCLNMQRCPHTALPLPHSPSSVGIWLWQLWVSADPGLLLALVSVCPALSCTVFTSLGASAICCTNFI